MVTLGDPSWLSKMPRHMEIPMDPLLKRTWSERGWKTAGVFVEIWMRWMQYQDAKYPSKIEIVMEKIWKMVYLLDDWHWFAQYHHVILQTVGWTGEQPGPFVKLVTQSLRTVRCPVTSWFTHPIYYNYRGWDSPYNHEITPINYSYIYHV